MTLTVQSGCKVNLLLNVLGKRADGFHELETLLQPIKLFDTLEFEERGGGIELTCNQPELPTDSRNLVYKAATAFFERSGVRRGVAVRLTKHIPVAAGLGGGSGNAGATLLALNELFGSPLTMPQLQAIAAELGSDVPFFLGSRPAVATGRGEHLEPVEAFPSLLGRYFLLVYPGFGVPTAWAYQHLAQFPVAVKGKPGRARQLANTLLRGTVPEAAPEFYNALELPVLRKYPLLAMIRDFLEESGAMVARMSGSGSTVFGIAADERSAKVLEDKVRAKFGPCWTSVVQ